MDSEFYVEIDDQPFIFRSQMLHPSRIRKHPLPHALSDKAKYGEMNIEKLNEINFRI